VRQTFDCLIVGGGAAGIGMGCVLQDLNVDFSILERGEIGTSFLLWPKEMRMITPSFTSNAFGMLDLNAIALQTSPAYTLGTEHPSGEEYARYLQAVADYRKLPVQTGIDVTAVRPVKDGFELETSRGTWFSRFVVWAAGEFQYPKMDGFPGAEYCVHSSLVREWSELEGEERVVIGGFESGADAAFHLSRLGKKVTVIDRVDRWTNKRSSDPSVELSPFTKDRLREIARGRICWLAGYEVYKVKVSVKEGYLVYCKNTSGVRRRIVTRHPPILATGFKGSLELVRHLFEQGSRGEILLNERDESTVTPGLFVSGPGVTHENQKFCFICKFRQRFAIIAETIAERLGRDTAVLEEYRKRGMMLCDLSCCEEDCKC